MYGAWVGPQVSRVGLCLAQRCHDIMLLLPGCQLMNSYCGDDVIGNSYSAGSLGQEVAIRTANGCQAGRGRERVVARPVLQQFGGAGP